MKRLSFYMCYICKKPYFAGRRECGNDPNMNNEDPNKDYNIKIVFVEKMQIYLVFKVRQIA